MPTHNENNSLRSAFTLIELLIVIAIVSVLMVIVLIVLNPGELLKQSRDSNRISDMQSIQSAMNLFTLDQPSALLGTAATTYVSLPDPGAPIGGNQCQSIGFPSSTYPFQCPASSTVRASNNTGWIPVNFNSISSGNPLSSLPIDPINQSSSGFFYSYTASGTQWEATSLLESQKYRTQFQSQNAPVPTYPGVIAKGSNTALSGLYSPAGLVGYWPMDEGSGNTTADASGNGNTGTLLGSTLPTWTAGKIGNNALNFDGSTSYVNVGNNAMLSPANAQTISAWFNYQGSVSNTSVIVGLTGAHNFMGLYTTGSVLYPELYWTTSGTSGGGTLIANTSPISNNTWYFLVMTYDSATGNAIAYLNGSKIATYSFGGTITVPGMYPVTIGARTGGTSLYFLGQIDDVRIYNRALSMTEVQAIYNAQR